MTQQLQAQKRHTKSMSTHRASDDKEAKAHDARRDDSITSRQTQASRNASERGDSSSSSSSS
jgi:hypothetical protein